MDALSTLARVQSSFVTSAHAQNFFFIKDQCFYIRSCFEEALFGGPLSNFKHTFLIRHPAKVTLSQHRKNFEALQPYNVRSTRFCHIHKAYHLVRERLDPIPIVVDADDLLSDPKGIMQKYCEATGLPFEENMVAWTPKSFPDWDNCQECSVWHGDVIKSSGFIQRECPSSPPAMADLPEEVRAVVEESLPYYEDLYRMRLR